MKIDLLGAKGTSMGTVLVRSCAVIMAMFFASAAGADPKWAHVYSDKEVQIFVDLNTVRGTNDNGKVNSLDQWEKWIVHDIANVDYVVQHVQYDCHERKFKIIKQLGYIKQVASPMHFEQGWQQPTPGSLVEGYISRVCR